MKQIVLLICMLGLLMFMSPTAAEEQDIIITVDSTNLQFSPSNVTVNIGQTVRFYWVDEILEHNAVSDIFTTGEPSSSVDYTFTFNSTHNGTYTFVCEPHEVMGMTGTITVNETSDNNTEDPRTLPAIPKEEDTTLMKGLLILAIIDGPVLALGYAVWRKYKE